ncbi:MAG: OmpA family protein [Myxococcota bacterium]
MRVNLLMRLWLIFVLLLGLELSTHTEFAFAQFDDAFDDEFDDSAPPPPSTNRRDDAFDDDAFDDDAFDDEFDDDAIESTSQRSVVPAGLAGDAMDEEAAADSELEGEAFDIPAQVDARPPASTDDTVDDDASEGTTEAAVEFAQSQPASVPQKPRTREETRWRNRFLATNTYNGPVGGIRVVDAGSGPTSSWRVQLASEFFFSNDFLENGDDHEHVGGSLSMSWTPLDVLEVFASIQSYANSNATSDPELFQVLGDASFGAKGFYRVLPFLTVGGDLSLELLNTVGDIGFVFESTSVGLRGNLSADLRELPTSIPLIGRFNVQYYFDNSEALIDDVESKRYNGLTDPLPIAQETRHLVTRVERFSLGINRTDFLNLALGFEAPLQVTDDFFLSPLVEWSWSVPVNRQGYDCLFVPGDASDDGCLDRSGISSFPMFLTLGLRVAPPVKGLGFTLGADVGLTGTDDFVRELSGTAPYTIMMAASYAFDTRTPVVPPPVQVERVREIEVPGPPPVMGRIRGRVVEQGLGTAVSDAVVNFDVPELSGQVTGADGSFVSYRFPPGAVAMQITHPDYEPGNCTATLPSEELEEGEHLIEVRCALVALPREGAVNATVVSESGSPIANVNAALIGSMAQRVSVDSDGHFRLQQLRPGSYRIRLEAEGYMTQVVPFEIQSRNERELKITLAAVPRRSRVQIRPRGLQVRGRIQFQSGGVQLSDASDSILQEIAHVLLSNPELDPLEIQSHTDNSGDSARNMRLSEQRAELVRQRLIDLGVPSTRLSARGYGQSRPLVPNITPRNRAQNRRMQFIFQK